MEEGRSDDESGFRDVKYRVMVRRRSVGGWRYWFESQEWELGWRG